MAAIAEALAPDALVELRCEITPPSPFRLPRLTGADGMTRRRDGVLERLLHRGGEPVLVRVAQRRDGSVLLAASAPSERAAEHGIERMRFALGVDDQIAPLLAEFARDPLIGASLRRRPWLRVGRRPDPFEALAWAVCEQLIDYESAAAIERRLLAALGRRWADAPTPPAARLRDMPSAVLLAGTAPARLQSFGLAGSRAIALVRVAREVARGRVELASEHEQAWRRLRAIPGIGAWTVEMLALRGQGREDQLPAGDLGLLKLVGRALSGGDPYARAGEADVRAFFAPYGRWAGLAAVHCGAL